MEIIPIEVKGGEDRSANSLRHMSQIMHLNMHIVFLNVGIVRMVTLQIFRYTWFEKQRIYYNLKGISFNF